MTAGRLVVAAVNVSLLVVLGGSLGGIAAKLATGRPAAAQAAVNAPLAAQEARLRRRIGRSHRRRPGATTPVLEPGVSPFEANVITEPELKTVRTIPIYRWQPWCDRVGGVEC